MAILQKQKVNVHILSSSDEWQGINTPEQLEEANKKMAERLKIKNG
jgi:bifunctional N-acetylglucosamine-1-phosphate-uridyltransferase/glucosamine-1-phosphate-acetyltransferase GlmU-like protein